MRRTYGQLMGRHGWRLAVASAVVAALVGSGGAARRAAAGQLQLGPASLLVTGQDTLTFRAQHVSGSEASRGAYLWDSYTSQSGFEHRTDLMIHGSVLPNLLVDATIARGPYALGRQRLTFTFDGSDAIVKAGDLAVAFDGCELAGFRRSLRGIQVDSKLARGALSLVASQAKPSVRSDVMYGRNSPGPYYLAASPVVDASEVVDVDGRRMQRGSDYSIDYQIGLVQFAPALIVPPTSRITVSYEYDPPGGQSGELIGMRALYPVTSRLRVGTTYLTLQRSGSRGASTAIKEDRWLGNGTAGPFTLTYRPIAAGSERVRLDGILQVQGRDYRIDYATGAIYFLQPVPGGVSVAVTYQITGVVQATPVDRSLIGIDTHFDAGRHFRLDAELAHSGGAVGSYTSGGSGGSAFALGLRGEWDRLTLSSHLRGAGAAFAPFESADLYQVRSGYDWSLGFQPLEGLRVSAATRDYRRPYLPYGDASVFVRDRTRDLSLDFNRPGWPTLSYAGSWSSLNGAGADALVERTGNQILTIGYDRSVYGFKATYRRSANSRMGESPLAAYSTYTSGPSSEVVLGDAYSGRGAGTALSMWYRPGDYLSVACDLARNGMTLTEGGSTSASTSRLAVDYAPSARTSISLGYRTRSASDAVSFDGRTVPGSAGRSATIGIRQSITPNLALNLAYDSQMSEGGYSTNSDSDAWTGGLFWQPAASVSIIGQYTRQKLAYLGASGRSSNDILSLGTTLGPFGPGLKLDLGYSHMRGVSSGTFGAYTAYGSSISATDDLGYSSYNSLAAQGMGNSSFRARFTCPVADRQEAFAEWETSSNSGYPGGNRRTALALGWQIEVAKGMNFVVDWRRIASDSADATYSYRAQSLSGQLGVKF